MNVINSQCDVVLENPREYARGVAEGHRRLGAWLRQRGNPAAIRAEQAAEWVERSNQQTQEDK